MISKIPPGFMPLCLPGAFIDANGPFFAKYDDQKFRIGIFLENRHCNAAGICHGGMLATFCDLQIALGIVVEAQIHSFLPTINLSIDYAAPGKQGDWLVGETQILRTTHNLAFGSCILTAAEQELCRATAVCKIPSREDSRFSLERLISEH